jgi:hypothetical protein
MKLDRFTFFAGCSASLVVGLLIAPSLQTLGINQSQTSGPKILNSSSQSVPTQSFSPREEGRRGAGSSSRLSPIQLLEVLAENESLITNYFSLPLFNSDLSVNTNLLELLGVDLEKGEELEGNVRAIFVDIRNIEKKNAEVLVHKDDEVLLSIPAFDSEVSEIFKKKIDSVFSEVLPERLAKVISSQFTKQNEDICSALLGRGRLLQIVPASSDAGVYSTPAKYTIKTVTRDSESGVEYLKENGFDAFSDLSGWEQSFDQLPEQWQHLFESD